MEMKRTMKAMDEGQTELSNCYFVKTILMLCVVFYHSMVFWTGNWFVDGPVYTSSVLKYFALWLNSFHTYGFTLVSGYLFYYLKFEKGKYNSFLPFLFNKAKRLLVPYVFSAVVWVIPISSVFYQFDFMTIVKNYILGTSPSQLWFLLMLFHVFMVAWVLSDWLVKHDNHGVVVPIVLYGLGILGSQFVWNIAAIWTACRYFMFFWIGFQIRRHKTLIVRKAPVWLYILTDILIFLLYQYTTKQDGILFRLLSLGVGCMLNILGSIMAFVVLQKLALWVSWKEKPKFLYLTERSMPIYLFHQQLIYILIYWFNGWIHPYIHVLVNFIAATVGSVFITNLLLKIKVTRTLIGE